MTMKKIQLLLVFPLLISGCAGTEDYTTTTESSTPSAEQVADTATQIETEDVDTVRQEGLPTVSAENPVGRDLNIVAIAQYNPNLSTFFGLIRDASLMVLLESPGNFTVFAPTNDAFNDLPGETLQMLKDPANKAELTRIIRSHIIEEKLLAEDLKEKPSFETAIGKPVKVWVDNGALVVGDAKVVKENVDASNGVIHIINKVLIPPKD